MIYHLHDLLQKMGAPELREKRRLEWYYFDKPSNRLAGYAEVRLEAGGEFLVAELKRCPSDDNATASGAGFEESFFLYAERTARPDHYRVTRMAFDGQDYGHPTKPIVELGLGVFQSRALDISIRMVEQTFNKDDMLAACEDMTAPAHTPAEQDNSSTSRPLLGRKLPRRRITRERIETPQKTTLQEAYGVVIPFRPRTAAGMRS